MKRFLIERHIPGVGQLTEQQFKDASATSNAALRATRVGEPAEEPHRRCRRDPVAPLNRVLLGHERFAHEALHGCDHELEGFVVDGPGLAYLAYLRKSGLRLSFSALTPSRDSSVS